MWDQRFSQEGFAYGTEPNDFLVASAEFIPPNGTVLCLGEGEGRNAVFLANRGHDVVAVDASAVGLAKAGDFARRQAAVVKTVQADLVDYSIAPYGYDAIVSIFCHLPPGIQRRLHQQIYQGLRPGGIFILEGYSKNQLQYGTGGPSESEMLMNLESIKDELVGLELRLAQETVREIHEGSYHNGPGAVIQVIAIKG